MRTRQYVDTFGYNNLRVIIVQLKRERMLKITR